MATEEIGQFSRQDVTKIDINIRNNDKRKKNIYDKFVIQKGFTTFTGRVSLKESRVQADIDLVNELQNLEANFMIWPSGGFVGSEFFKLEVEGWRLQDLYLVQNIAANSPNFLKNIYINGLSHTLSLVEVV